MYIGNTSQLGLQHLVMELIDNVADQFLLGKATRIQIEIDQQLISVIDDGVGLPFDQPCEDFDSLAEQYLTRLHRTPTADKHFPHVHFMGWGLGLFIANALTESMNVRSWRNGQRYEQSFSRGIAESPAEVIELGNDIGTAIMMSPDPMIFNEQMVDVDKIVTRCKTISHLIPGFELCVNGQTFFSPDGLADWARELAGLRESDNLFSIDQVVGEYRFQVAVAGNSPTVTRPRHSTQWKTFANGNETHEGGTHLRTLKQVLSKVGWRPKVAMLHVTMQTPRFSGPTQSRLEVNELVGPLRSTLLPALSEYCSGNGIGSTYQPVRGFVISTATEAIADHHSNVPGKNSSINSS